VTPVVRNAAAGLLVGLAAAALVVGADALFRAWGGGAGANPLATAELKTYDWRLSHTARPESARADIVLVEIDEYSLRNMEPLFGRWPWPRAAHAILIDYLSRGGPTAVLYDVNFAGPDTRRGVQYGPATMSGADSDRALADAVARAGNVVLLADATYEGGIAEGAPHAAAALPDAGFRVSAPGIVDRQVVFPPYPELAAAAAGFGHNLFILDADGPLRHAVPFVTAGGRGVPLLGVAGALRAAGIAPDQVRVADDRLLLGDRRMALTDRRVRTSGGIVAQKWTPINFRGPGLLADLKSRPYAHYAAWDLIRAEDAILRGEAPAIDPGLFRAKLVFVGVTAAGLHDVFETPFAAGRMPGVQVHAAVADDILSDRGLIPAPDWSRVAMTVSAGAVIGVLAALAPAWWATAATVVLGAAAGWLITRQFAAGLWLNMVQPALASALALFGGVGYQYVVEGREKRRMKRLFGQYVSKDVCEQLVAHPELARLGGSRREMTVLFSDIRGFTTFSERGRPEDIVGVLNEYFTRMTGLVFEHQGTLDKFVGDMVMALYGAPLDDPLHADHAVETALRMVEELATLNQRWEASGGPRLDIGIGISTGPMIAGNIGSETIMSYTVIGDAVNLGARLESLNKEFGTRIIISDETRRRLTRGYALRPLGEVVVKGKTAAVAIFEVAGRPAVSEAQT
jgi:adenylate cyclase